MSIFNNPVPQILDNNGDPSPGAQLFFFETGTSTLKTIFADSSFTTAQSNPVITDASGRLTSDVYLDGVYRVVGKTAGGVNIDGWGKDPVGEVSTSQLPVWANDATYNIPDIVVGSDDNHYRTLTDNNQGNDPISSAANWEQLYFGRVYNANVTYGKGEAVKNSTGVIYKSLIASNLGNALTDKTSWEQNRAKETFNSIINGGMRVSQGSALSITNSYLVGSTDLMGCKSDGTISAGTIGNAAAAFVGTTGRAARIVNITVDASGVEYCTHRIEAANVKHHIDKPATFVCQVYHDVGSAVDYTITINKADVADDFSAVTQIATSAAATSVADQTATTLSLVVADMGSCGNGVEVEVKSVSGAVTTKNFYFADYDLRQTTEIYDFIPGDAGIDLVNCKYYRKELVDPGLGLSYLYSGQAVSTTSMICPVPFEEMLGTPTVTLSNFATFDVTAADGTANAATSITAASITDRTMNIVTGVAAVLVAGNASNLRSDSTVGNTSILLEADLF